MGLCPQLVRFARASGCIADFGTRDGLLTQGLLKQAVGVVGFAKPFLGFVDDAVVWCLSSGVGLGLSSAKGFRSLGSMVALCVN